MAWWLLNYKLWSQTTCNACVWHAEGSTSGSQRGVSRKDTHWRQVQANPRCIHSNQHLSLGHLLQRPDRVPDTHGGVPDTQVDQVRHVLNEEHRRCNRITVVVKRMICVEVAWKGSSFTKNKPLFIICLPRASQCGKSLVWGGSSEYIFAQSMPNLLQTTFTEQKPSAKTTQHRKALKRLRWSTRI